MPTDTKLEPITVTGPSQCTRHRLVSQRPVTKGRVGIICTILQEHTNRFACIVPYQRRHIVPTPNIGVGTTMTDHPLTLLCMVPRSGKGRDANAADAR